jgi:hypothetical protein
MNRTCISKAPCVVKVRQWTIRAFVVRDNGLCALCVVRWSVRLLDDIITLIVLYVDAGGAISQNHPPHGIFI